MADPRPTEILLTAAQIQARVAEMAAEIRRDLPDHLHLIAVLKGAAVFAADLMRHLGGRVSVDFVELSSYGAGTTSAGDVRLIKDFDAPIHGSDVVILDDIADTGRTIASLQEMLRARGPRSLRTACLLDKPSRRKTPVPVDYVGFTIPDRFVVGYGLDYNGEYRNLPHIAVLD